MLCDTKYATASFKGIPFDFLSSSVTGGRRIVTHKYPFSNYHFNEDLGDEPKKFSVSGCFHGKDFRKKLFAAEKVWLLEGDGVFFEPNQNKPHATRLLSFVVDHNSKKINYVSFKIELVEMNNDPYTSNRFGLFDNVKDNIDKFIKKANQSHANVVQIIGEIM